MKRIVGFFTRLCEAYLPDAFVFCLLLTLIVFAFGFFFTPHSLSALVGFWGKEFWSLNAFAMQMVFVLISGHMLATTPLVKKGISKITARIRNETQALVLITCFSTIACWINWGFGLISSAILAVEIAKRLKRLNFGLLVASAYSGFLVWHGGFSGSIPLKIAGHDEILQKVYPGLSLPLTETILTPVNLLITVLCLALLPLTALWMRTPDKVEVSFPEVPKENDGESSRLRDKLELSPFFNYLFFLIFVVYLISAFRQGEGLDINKVNWIFLFLAIFLHKTPRAFLVAVKDSFIYASDIVIQFPFYAGIMGLMQYSGLSDLMSEVFISIATTQTLPFWTFISGGVVNFFIPSGGGQWVVQGPFIMKAAQTLSADPKKVAMALAWGDAWTNLVQPFWALPLLGLAKLQLKDIMGYCLIFTALSGVVISVVLLFS